MNTLEAPSAAGDQQADELHAEYIRQQPLDLDAERQRQQQWWETGESNGPNHIAVIRLTNEQIELLRQSITFDYHEFGAPVLDEDDQVAAESAAKEDVPVLNAETRAVLRNVLSFFEQMRDEDLERNGIVPTAAPTLLMQAGIYTDSDEDMHVDDPGTFALRYGLTVLGPGTEWPRGTVNPEDFDIAAGDYIGQEQLTNPREYSEAGTVEQFITGCDPHTPAVVDGEQLESEGAAPELRITMFSTISV